MLNDEKKKKLIKKKQWKNMSQFGLNCKSYDHGHIIKINQQKEKKKEKKIGRSISNKLNIER